MSSFVNPLTSGSAENNDLTVTFVNATLLTLCVLLGWATIDLLQGQRQWRVTPIQRRIFRAIIVLTTVAALGVGAFAIL
ncbi:hypothetical protein ACQP2Y_15155 [Actinoplanes sp. CA-051413]|uniref:hypothetical protein n=1 Tax=Actinoplanes sp. CA-051413 TaxID=3239899 RepID=UPI003D99DF2C